MDKLVQKIFLACNVAHPEVSDDGPDDLDLWDECYQAKMGLNGRPHWGKMHNRTAENLRPVYPRFDDFLAIRDRLDPGRLFANDYLRKVLGE